ncbi:Swt1 family HEPN domain-containing protein [Pararhodospirillum oryzae]|uniref:Uncharacterized protein n=1 Tax=Pararhodospirillum oryzae TaxID=478448 RepID=A0A512HC73_9PROT|nr:Swt1 family HEPN domain-containing protein [Pararhodospirillum oryzae]GEO83056.1 hypothetical protein ROR02_31870 [Pararhodospirillum oryzae]
MSSIYERYLRELGVSTAADLAKLHPSEALQYYAEYESLAASLSATSASDYIARQSMDAFLPDIAGLNAADHYSSAVGAANLVERSVIEDLARGYPSGIAAFEQDRLSNTLRYNEISQIAQFESPLASYRESAATWAAGEDWKPAAHSLLSGMDMAHVSSVNSMMEDWRTRDGYAQAFSTLASMSDDISGSAASFDRYASLVGDLRHLNFTPDFKMSPEARLVAYRDVGFDTEILKPNQRALSAMLSINGYPAPNVWARYNRIIVPKKKVKLSDHLRNLKPTQFQIRGYGEARALEVWLREFIDQKMSLFYGDDWYKEHAPRKIIGKLEKNGVNQDNMTGEIVLKEADFAHYLSIIEDHWDNVFEEIFVCWDETHGMLKNFKNLRVAIMHHKGFGKADLVQLRVCARWFEEKIDAHENDQFYMDE